MSAKKEKTVTGASCALAVQSNESFTALANADFSTLVSDELDGLDLIFERAKRRVPITSSARAKTARKFVRTSGACISCVRVSVSRCP